MLSVVKQVHTLVNESLTDLDEAEREGVEFLYFIVNNTDKYPTPIEQKKLQTFSVAFSDTWMCSQILVSTPILALSKIKTILSHHYPDALRIFMSKSCTPLAEDYRSSYPKLFDKTYFVKLDGIDGGGASTSGNLDTNANVNATRGSFRNFTQGIGAGFGKGTGQLQPCHNHYLRAACHLGPNCRYSHTQVLTAKDLEDLKWQKKKTCCQSIREGKTCSFGDTCIYGHKCPFGANCTRVCSFPPEAHDGPRPPPKAKHHKGNGEARAPVATPAPTTTTTTTHSSPS